MSFWAEATTPLALATFVEALTPFWLRIVPPFYSSAYVESVLSTYQRRHQPMGCLALSSDGGRALR